MGFPQRLFPCLTFFEDWQHCISLSPDSHALPKYLSWVSFFPFLSGWSQWMTALRNCEACIHAPLMSVSCRKFPERFLRHHFSILQSPPFLGELSPQGTEEGPHPTFWAVRSVLWPSFLACETVVVTRTIAKWWIKAVVSSTLISMPLLAWGAFVLENITAQLFGKYHFIIQCTLYWP